VSRTDGHRSRLVQVCIDAPASVHDREVAFWRRLLAGRRVESTASEFSGTWHDDDGSPLQLLFQRLDEPDGPVRAHLDHGTDDLGPRCPGCGTSVPTTSDPAEVGTRCATLPACSSA